MVKIRFFQSLSLKNKPCALKGQLVRGVSVLGPQTKNFVKFTKTRVHFEVEFLPSFSPFFSQMTIQREQLTQFQTMQRLHHFIFIFSLQISFQSNDSLFLCVGGGPLQQNIIGFLNFVQFQLQQLSRQLTRVN